MIDLLSMSLDEIAEWARSLGQPRYRAEQLFRWAHKGVPISEMSDIPKDFKGSLEGRAVANPVATVREEASRTGNASKALYRMADGQLVEGVLMRHSYGVTLCVSTQAGCAMGCAFCASTKGGLARDLSAGEIVGQVVASSRSLGRGERIGNVVLMGSGEPLDNYESSVKAIRLMCDARGLNLSARGISLSTCGLVPEMIRLAGEGLPITLCLSLHAPNDAVRAGLMPVARRYGIAETIEACRRYVRETGRRVIFEYALIDGVNDSLECASELASLVRGMQCHVNLLRLNPIPESDLTGSSDSAAAAFMKRLEARKVSASARARIGLDVGGACGQLRRLHSANDAPANGGME